MVKALPLKPCAKPPLDGDSLSPEGVEEQLRPRLSSAIQV